MNVLRHSKKILSIGLLAMSVSMTGCLTDDDDDDPAVNKGTALSVEKSDTVWNLQGPKRGAYNLVAGESVASDGSETVKDVKDMSVVATAGVSFPMTLTSGNGTLFVIAPSTFDYATATDSTLIKAYASVATPAAVTPILKANDVILAKLRNSSRYAAIKIKTVNVTSADNLDFFYFGFRLTP